MRKLKTIIIVCLLLQGCKAQSDCHTLKTKFSSYSQAISKIKVTKFLIAESANTSNSSWINSADYYSCDGESGYLIYTTNKGDDYIHANVPYDIWEGFKNASSKGSYLDRYIKGKYKLVLN